MTAKPRPITSAEIDRRLWIVSELRNLCISLGRAKRVPNDHNLQAKSATGKATPERRTGGS